VIVAAGARLARYGDVIGEKTGLDATGMGSCCSPATTSLPEVLVYLSRA
jgi:hypothetical protein